MGEIDGKTVYMGNINPGSVSSIFTTSLVDSVMAGVFSHVHMEDSPPYLDMYRNRVMLKWLTGTEDSHILFIDSDIGWRPEDVINLVTRAPDDAVVSGVYWGNFKPEGLSPVIMDWVYEENIIGDEGRDVLRIIGEEKWNELCDKYGDEHIPVQACGAGFLLIPRPIALRMQMMFSKSGFPWFATLAYNDIPMGEDEVFCTRLNMIMEVPLLIDPTVEGNLSHDKTIRYWSPRGK